MSINKRAVIIEDQSLLRDLVTAVLEQELGLTVEAQFADGDAGLEGCLKLKPDLVVLDLVIPQVSGLSVLSLLRQELPETRVAVLSSHLTSDTVRAVLSGGAHGLMSKDLRADDLAKGLLEVVEGGCFVDPTAQQLLAESKGETERPSLTARESEVLRLVADGLSSRDVAERLGLGVRTVETHRANVMRKLDVHSSSEMIRTALRLRLIAD